MVLRSIGLLPFAFCLSLALLPACTATPATAPTATATARKPHHTYVIVHGAWGGAWNFHHVADLLARDGNQVSRVTLTGQGERVHLASPKIGLDTHIQDVVNHILYEDLHDVVLVGHSYGGMVITGVADRIPDRIAHLIYVDACLPENGQSLDDLMNRPGHPRLDTANPDGFIYPKWVKPGTPPPHDVPQSAKTFSDPIHLTNQDAVKKIPTTYILTVDPGKQPNDDAFFSSYERAKKRGYATEIMTGDHNVQWSHPDELVRRLEQAVP